MMRAALGAANPNDASIEKVLPGVQKRFDIQDHEMKRMDARAERRHKELMEAQKRNSDELRSDLAEAYGQVADRLSGTKRFGGSSGGGGKRQRVEEDDEEDVDLEGLAFQTRKPESVEEVYNEYKGLGVYEGYPIRGGLEAVETKTKRKWRCHFSAADQKHFSRVIALVGAIDSKVEGDTTFEEVVEEMEVIFKEKNKSFSGLIDELQKRGVIQKKGRRKKRSVPTGGGGGN